MQRGLRYAAGIMRRQSLAIGLALASFKNGYLESRLFIANLELGDEIQRGSGTTLIRNYAVNVE